MKILIKVNIKPLVKKCLYYRVEAFFYFLTRLKGFQTRLKIKR